MKGTTLVRASAALVLTLAATSVPAQDRRPVAAASLQLTLEDAVHRAIEHNPDLALVRLGTEDAAASVGESRSAFTPELSTTLGRSSQTTPPSSFLLGVHGVDARDWFSSTGIRQRLPWGGGSWSVSWDASRTTSNDPFTSFDPSLQSGLMVAFSQPLLKDRTLDAARHQYIIARRNEQSSELQLQESVVQTVAAVKVAYWTLKATRANVTVQQRSLELAGELVRQTQARVDAGQAPPLDLVQAQAEVAQRRDNLIRATSADGDAEDALRRLIMDPSDASFWQTRLDPVDEPDGGAPAPDVEQAVAAALAGRYDLARARNDVANAATDVTFFRNQRLPDVRLEASYSGRGLGGTQLLRTGPFPGTITGTSTSGFGDVLNQVFAHDYATWSLGLTVSYPLGRSYEDAALARASVERRQAAERLASLQLQAAEAVRKAVRQVRSTAQRIDAARAGVTLADERVKTEERRYEVGLSTSFLVTQAQRDLVQAQVTLVQATLDHQTALVDLEALQQAPPLAAGQTVGLEGSTVVRLPTPAPTGVFRSGAGSGGQ